MEATNWVKENLKVLSEKEYDPENYDKRVKSVEKMVDSTLEREINWTSFMEKHLSSESDSTHRLFLDYRECTGDQLKLMCSPRLQLCGRNFFYLYNQCIYTRPSTSPRHHHVDDMLKRVRQMPNTVAGKAVVATLMGAGLFAAYAVLPPKKAV